MTQGKNHADNTPLFDGAGERACEHEPSQSAFKTYSSARKSKEQQEFEDEEVELIQLVVMVILLWAAVIVVWSDIFIFRNL